MKFAMGFFPTFANGRSGITMLIDVDAIFTHRLPLEKVNIMKYSDSSVGTSLSCLVECREKQSEVTSRCVASLQVISPARPAPLGSDNASCAPRSSAARRVRR